MTMKKTVQVPVTSDGVPIVIESQPLDKTRELRTGEPDGTAAPQLLGQISVQDYPRLQTVFGDNKMLWHSQQVFSQAETQLCLGHHANDA